MEIQYERAVGGIDEPHNRSTHDSWIDPEKRIEYTGGIRKPWMAFRILAAGVIPPEEGSRYALEKGADFVHLGMFDFQVAEDAVIATSVLAGQTDRQRPRIG